MNQEEIKLSDSIDKEYWIPCIRCNHETCHKSLVSVDISGKESSWDYYYHETYQVIECQGCKARSFRWNQTNSEDFVEDKQGKQIYIDHEQLYPSRVAGRQKLHHRFYLPHNVAQIYDETHAALCSKQPILTGIGIRALLETVCKEKAALGGNLEGKIDSLVQMGVLTQEGAEILHSLRILGNVAAHEVKPHSEETLGIAMEVVEHLLKGAYILPGVAGKLPKRNKSGTP